MVRDYYHTSEDLLNRRLQVWNFNGIYDTRSLYISAREGSDGSIFFYLSPSTNIIFTAENTVANFVFEKDGTVITVGSYAEQDGETIKFKLDNTSTIPSGTSDLGIRLTVNNTTYYIETKFSQ